MRDEKECVCSKIMSVCVCSKIIKELPGLVGSGTPYITIIMIIFLDKNLSASTLGFYVANRLKQ